jgi:hypothetical protein
MYRNMLNYRPDITQPELGSNHADIFPSSLNESFMYRRPILCTLYGAVDFLNVLKITIYTTVIYTAPCIIFWSRRGLGPGIREFLGPLHWHQADIASPPPTPHLLPPIQNLLEINSKL